MLAWKCYGSLVAPAFKPAKSIHLNWFSTLSGFACEPGRIKCLNCVHTPTRGEETGRWNNKIIKHQVLFEWSIEDASGKYCTWAGGVGWWWGETGGSDLSGDLPPVGSPDWILLLDPSIKTLSLRLNSHIYSADYTYSPLWNSSCAGVKTLLGMAHIKRLISNARLWNPAGHQKLSLAAESDRRGHCMEINTLI